MTAPVRTAAGPPEPGAAPRSPAGPAGVPAALREQLAARAAALEAPGAVGRDVWAELADAGLAAVYGPSDLGGRSAAEQRLVAEQLAGASSDAWFVWFQHGPVVRALLAGTNAALADALVPGLCSGVVHGGVAWSTLRTARPTLHATRLAGGDWEISGTQPWCTAWPLLDVVLVGGLDAAADQVVFGVLPADTPGLRSAGALDLSVMSGTATHALTYDRVRLPAERVTDVLPYTQWLATDRARNTNVQPSTFGVARAALDLLAGRAGDAAAGGLDARVATCREAAYRLADEVDPHDGLDQRLALRAEALHLATSAALAAVTATGGRGMGRGEPAERLLRASAFQIVHSQDADVRAATLHRWR